MRFILALIGCAIYLSIHKEALKKMSKTTQQTYRIVTLSGRGLPVTVDRDDTRAAAEAMADACHDGEFRVEEESALPTDECRPR